MKKILYLFGILMAACLLAACSSGGSGGSTTEPEDNPYIAAYTRGELPTTTIVRVRLTQAVEPAENRDEQLKNIFKFSPSVDGEVFWEGNNTVGFRPKERLKNRTEYKVTFNVAKLFSDAGGKDKNFNFSFSTIAPSFTRTLEGLRTSEEKEDEFYLDGEVRLADYAGNEQVEALLTAEVDGKKATVQWEHREYYHSFLVEHLPAGNKPYKLVLKWTGKPIDYDYTQTDTVTVPAKGVFEVLNVKVNADNSSFDCLFSAPLNPKQKYASYIQVGNFNKLRFSTSSNKLTVYLPSRQDSLIRLTVKEGLSAASGKTLQEDYNAELQFEELKPDVKLTGKGVIMPNSSGLHIPFRAVNVKAVDVEIYRTYENNILQFLQVNDLNGEDELYRVGRSIAKKTLQLDADKSLNLKQWNTFSIDLASLIAPEPGAMYTVQIKFNKRYSLYTKHSRPSSGDNEEEEYDYYYYDSNNNPDNYYYYTNRAISQNVLTSNIGLVVKKGSDNNYLIFVTNLVTAEPMSGVKVMFYDYLQQKTEEGVSGSNGVVQIESKQMPYVVVAQDGVQKSYLRMGDERSLSLSSFDVSGRSVYNGLKGLIYGERDVWRPGDTLFLTFVLEDRTKRLPDNHPVNFKLYDVNRRLVTEQVRTQGHNGFYTFICPTNPDDPSGDWRAVVSVGGVTFDKTLRVATIKPNRLKIETKLDHDPVLAGQSISGTLKVRWLHGATTGGNETDFFMRLVPVRTTFKNYQDFAFDDVTKRFSDGGSKEVEDRLDDKGELRFSIPVETGKAPSGKLRAAVTVNVAEEGGEFSTDNFGVDIYPYEAYVGLKLPKGTGYYNRMETDKEHKIEVVAVDATGKPVKRKLDVEIYRNEWYWWWFSSNGNMADYANRLYNHPVFAIRLETDATGKASFNYSLKYPEWGLFLVKVTDPKSGHSTTQKMYIDWWGYGRGSDDENNGATVLSFTTDKEKYNVDEQAVVTIPSTAGARAIVTVENGSRVITSYQVDCKGDETKVTIPTTTEMIPNAYVYVTLLQPHQQTANDLPMRLYGVVPLFVEDPATRLEPAISMANDVRPEQAFTVNVKEEKGREMTYTLAIVDDGLLDLTHFKTPDLWNYFFQREALGVRTWDLYNFVLGAYGGKIEQLFSIGGGDEGEDAGAKEKANRFKPVVKFVGPFTLKAGETGKHAFTISNYVGSVRVMVVAGSGRAYGKAEKTVPVRSPLMLQATLPRVLGPAEEVTLPVAVFAMEKQVKNVKVELKPDAMLEPLDGTSRTLAFAEPSDELVKFNLRVRNKLGVARVKVIATSGKERAEHEIEIDVRAANPPVMVSKDTILQGAKSVTLALKTPGIEGSNTVQLEVSSIPPLNLGNRLEYLLQYPHGCLEQTTSGMFPQLFLPDVVEMTAEQKGRMNKNIEAGLKRLTYFVKQDGSFSYWPGGTGYGCEWTNNYAGHFMVEAERKGYKIPGTMKNNWIAYQQRAARNWSVTDNNSRYAYSQNDLVQAYRLYVLALDNKQELGAMNRLKERTDLSPQAKWMLAGAYKLAGQPEAADKLIESLPAEATYTYNGFSNTYGSSERDDAVVLNILTLLGRKENAFIMARRVSAAMNGNRWMSTQTTGFSLLALSKYALSGKGTVQFDYSIGKEKAVAVKAEKSVWTKELGQRDGTVNLKIDNNGNQTLFARFTAKGIPAAGEEKAVTQDLRITVRYTDAKGNGIAVDRLEQGTDFQAEVSIYNPGQRGHYTNMALTHIFPSGWEITDNRLEDEQQEGITYRDIRDDRVLSYFDLRSGATVKARVKLRAAYTGKFYLPAVACEAMYDATIHANTTGQQVEVY